MIDTRKAAFLLGILAWFLALVGRPGVATADKVDDLVRQLRRDPDYKVRLSAALNLGKIGDPRAVPALTEALRDSDKTVRGVAAAALGKLVDRRVPAKERAAAIAELERVLRADPDAFVRSQARKSYDILKNLGDGAPSTAPAAGIYVEVGPMSDSTRQGGPKLLTAMRTTISKTIRSKGTDLVTEWPSGRSPTKADLSRAGTRAAYYVDGTLTTLDVKKTGSMAEVTCNVSLVLATYPDKAMFGFLKGGAQVQTGATERDIDEGKQDCVGAVLEDIVARQVVPTIRSRTP